MPGYSGLAILAASLLPGLAGIGSSAAAGTITVVGTLTDKGVECPALQGDDGKLYTLTPRQKVGEAAIGARIRVEGAVAEMSACQQGITIEVSKVESAE